MSHRDPKPTVATLVAGTLHASAQFRGRREADAPEWVLIHTSSGAGIANDAPARAGDEFLLAPPGVELAFRTDPRVGAWSATWVHFIDRPAWLPLLAWPPLGDGASGLRCLDFSRGATSAASIRRRLDDVCSFSLGPHAHRDTLAANALEEVLLWCAEVGALGATAAADAVDPRILAATRWLCANLACPITLDRTANAVGLSASRLAHLFREQMGVPPLQYLEAQRMRRARELLTLTGRPVREVAAEVGFGSAVYFAARFRRAHGAMPADYRRQLATSAELDGETIGVTACSPTPLD